MEYEEYQELTSDLEQIDVELTPEQIVWLEKHYGKEIADKVAQKKKLKKAIWQMMQHNNILKALIAESKAIKKQALVEMSLNKSYKNKLLRTAKKNYTHEQSLEM